MEGSLEAALIEGARAGAARKLTGKEEALLVATACSGPPAGRKRWTLALLADEMVRLSEHDQVSRETVRQRRKDQLDVLNRKGQNKLARAYPKIEPKES